MDIIVYLCITIYIQPGKSICRLFIGNLFFGIVKLRSWDRFLFHDNIKTLYNSH